MAKKLSERMKPLAPKFAKEVEQMERDISRLRTVLRHAPLPQHYTKRHQDIMDVYSYQGWFEGERQAILDLTEDYDD